MFVSCIGEWLHDARCLHLECCQQIGTLLKVSAGSASCFPAWKQTYRLQSTGWCEIEKSALIFRSRGIFKPQCHWEEMDKWFGCLFEFELLVHLYKPFAARGLADWRRSSCMDGSLGQRMTNADPISKPIDLTLQNSSRSNGLICKGKHLLPTCKPLESQVKGQSHTSYLKRRD